MLNETNIPLEEDGIEEEILVDEELAITKAMWGDIGGNIANQTDLKAALDAKQDSLTEAQLNAVNSGITAEKVTTYDGYADQIASKANQSALNAEATTRAQADTALGRRIDDEATARQNADNGLQTQIDAITSKSDVVDVVANYAALQAYDTSSLGNNDVIKVLDDETHEDALTYYRWSTASQTWSYIGQEAPYYSKGQMDVMLQGKQNKLTAGANIQIENDTISAEIALTRSITTPATTTDAYYLKSLEEVSGTNAAGVQYLYAYGKNLLDVTTLAPGYLSSGSTPAAMTSNQEMYSGFIKVKPNTTYTFTKFDGLEPPVINYDWIGICEYRFPAYANGIIKRTVATNTTVMTFTTTAETQFVAVSARGLTTATMIQLEEGDTSTAWEEFKGGTARLDLYTNNLLDSVTPTYLNAFLRNDSGEIVADDSARSLVIPCEPNTVYVVTRDDTQDWNSICRLGCSEAMPNIGDTTRVILKDWDGSRATSGISTATGANAHYLTVYYKSIGTSGGNARALAGLSIYKASDVLQLSDTTKIERTDGGFKLVNGAVESEITNSSLVRQLNELDNAEFDLTGTINYQVYSRDNTPANLMLEYWTGAKGEKGGTAEVEAIGEKLDHSIDYDKTVLGINHRGYNYIAPENTLSAFRLSKQMGFNYVETDVSFTSDSVAVCLHDDTIDRTSNGTGNINDLTYDQVSQYDFGSWKSPAYAGEKIPTLEQFIKLCRNLGLKPYIELKNSATYSEAQIQSIVDIVERNGMRGKVTYISFNATYLGYIKNYDDEARLGYLADITSATITTTTGLKTSSNEVFIDTSYGNATSAKVQLAMAAHLPVEVWTVDSESIIIGLDSYVTGVTSDNLIAGKVLYESNIED